ncbi:hypothetical protein quinque_004105 [Culex quinquefasciatus]
MSSQQKHRIQVPDGLRDVLLEFSIAYLLEQPGDVIDYAVEFFSKLQENRKTTMITAAEPISPDESIMSHEEDILGRIIENILINLLAAVIAFREAKDQKLHRVCARIGGGAVAVEMSYKLD